MRISSVSPLLEEGRGNDDSQSSGYAPDSAPRLRGGADPVVIAQGAVGCVVGVFIVLGLFVSLGTAKIPPNHVGIQMNVLSKVVDKTNVFHAGRHIGMWKKYIVFPLNIQNVKMELDSRTAEGYPLQLKAEFQYQLLPDKILELYDHYTTKYEPVFQRNVRAALMKSVSDYDARDLFTSRKAILDDMHSRIDAVLRESYARCWGVQFDDVKQPAAFEKTLLQTQLQKWFANTKLAEQQVSAINAHTSVLKAEFDKNISVVNSSATVRCRYIISEADANSMNYQNEALANATLLTDQAHAQSSKVIREAQAGAELEYQKAVATGTGQVLMEKAEADKRTVQLQGLRLKYWKELVQLSPQGMIQFQRLLGDYKQLQDIKFLVGFQNTYATAEASPDTAGIRHGGQRAADVVELAAIGGNAAGSAAAEVKDEDPGKVRRLDASPNDKIASESSTHQLFEL